MRVQSFLLAASALLVMTGCPRQQEQGGPGGMGGLSGMPPTPVRVEPVVMADYAPAIELVGEIRAAQRATLVAEVGGRVISIAHRVGESQPANRTLIQISRSDYQAMLNGAQAQLAQAQEALRLAEKGPREQEIAAQEAQVAAAAAQYEHALDNLNRQQWLYEQGVTAESVLVAARTQAEAAEAALNAQQEILGAFLEGTREEDIKRARAAVALAQSQVDQAELALAKTSIEPAFDAVVVNLYVEVGSFVGPGTHVAEVVADSSGEAWFNLPETDVGQVNAGDLVELRLDALPDVMITGTVISVSRAADAMSRQFPVRVAVNDERPLPGMVVHGRLLTEEPKPTLMIKRDATVLGSLGLVAFVMGQPTGEEVMPGVPAIPVQQVRVVTGDTYGDLVIVLEGDLQPGMMVVTRGNEQLYPGANIIPTNLQQDGEPGEGSMLPDGGPPATEDGQAQPNTAETTSGDEQPAGEA